VAGAVFGDLVKCIGAEEGASSPQPLSHTWLVCGAQHVLLECSVNIELQLRTSFGCLNIASRVY
jgi:hypothetical protein